MSIKYHDLNVGVTLGSPTAGGCKWTTIAEVATTGSWQQEVGEVVFFVLYWNAYQVWTVFIGRNNACNSNLIVNNGNVGGNPSFAYDSTTKTVTATWPAVNYAKILQ